MLCGWQAEELMRKIEKEEERVAYDQPDKKVYHLCIVNLVIGYFIIIIYLPQKQQNKTIVYAIRQVPVSYTHLTLPTNREV